MLPRSHTRYEMTELIVLFITEAIVGVVFIAFVVAGVCAMAEVVVTVLWKDK